MQKKLFVNTVPHSGTHLVTRILDLFGYSHLVVRNRIYTGKPFFRRSQRAGVNWRTSSEVGPLISILDRRNILVSVASPRMAKRAALARTLSETAPGQYLIGHMPYTEEGGAVVRKYIDKIITVVRDPRDMSLSMLNHVRARPNHHAYKYLFEVLKSESERKKEVIVGYNNEYGHIVGLQQMYMSVLKWKDQTDHLLIKFEDLVGTKGGGSQDAQLRAIASIANFLEITPSPSAAQLAEVAKKSFGYSKTFRKGRIGGWRAATSDNEIKLYQEQIGDLLLNLHYE